MVRVFFLGVYPVSYLLLTAGVAANTWPRLRLVRGSQEPGE